LCMYIILQSLVILVLSLSLREGKAKTLRPKCKEETRLLRCYLRFRLSLKASIYL
jgi:hypothetical protein